MVPRLARHLTILSRSTHETSGLPPRSLHIYPRILFMPPKAKPKSPAVAPVIAATFAAFEIHSHFHSDRVAVLSADQRRILTSPAGTFEVEKDAIHKALLERRNAYCAECLAAGQPGVHPTGLDPDVTEDDPFRALDVGRGVVDRCPFHGRLCRPAKAA